MGKMLLAVLATILFPFMALGAQTPNVLLSKIGQDGSYQYYQANVNYTYNNSPERETTCLATSGSNVYKVAYDKKSKACTKRIISKALNPDKVKNFTVGNQTFQGWPVIEKRDLLPGTSKTRFTNPDGTAEDVMPVALYAHVKNGRLEVAGNIETVSENPGEQDENGYQLYTVQKAVITPTSVPTAEAPKPTVLNIVLQPEQKVVPPPAVQPPEENNPPRETVPVESQPTVESSGPVCHGLLKEVPPNDPSYCSSIKNDSCDRGILKYDCHLGGQSGCSVTKCLEDYNRVKKSENVQQAVEKVHAAYKAYEQAELDLANVLKQQSAGAPCVNFPEKPSAKYPGTAYYRYLRLQTVEEQRQSPKCQQGTSHPARRRATRKTASVDDGGGSQE